MKPAAQQLADKARAASETRPCFSAEDEIGSVESPTARRRYMPEAFPTRRAATAAVVLTAALAAGLHVLVLALLVALSLEVRNRRRAS